MGPADFQHAELADNKTEEAPTRELAAAPAAGAEDRCTNCGSPLAHDQRYCVECGERRGQSRFPVAQPVTEVRTRRTRSVRTVATPPRISSGTTLVAGIGVLLLAIGLGVLIGSIAKKNNTSTRASAPPPQVIFQGGGSGATTASTPTAKPKTIHVTAKGQAKLKAAAKATAPPPAAVQQKATQAASKVLGSSAHLAPPTVTTGQKCSSSQAGCSGGKFNGNFFGP